MLIFSYPLESYSQHWLHWSVLWYKHVWSLCLDVHLLIFKMCEVCVCVCVCVQNTLFHEVEFFVKKKIKLNAEKKLSMPLSIYNEIQADRLVLKQYECPKFEYPTTSFTPMVHLHHSYIWCGNNSTIFYLYLLFFRESFNAVNYFIISFSVFPS